jgi:hypothetical protein
MDLYNLKTIFKPSSIAIQLTLISSGLHFYWGAPRALMYYNSGIFSDWRPYALTFSAVLIWSAVILSPRYISTKRLYLLCALFMLIHLIGYIAWHLFGHPLFDPNTANLLIHHHPSNPLLIIYNHISHDKFARVTLISEIWALLSFTYLFLKPNVSS